MPVTILEGKIANVAMIAIHIGKCTDSDTNLYYGLAHRDGAYRKAEGWELDSLTEEDYRLSPPFNIAMFTDNCRHGYIADAPMVKASLSKQRLFKQAFPELLKYLTKVKTCR